MKKFPFAMAILIGVGVMAGCSSSSEPEFGDKKEDWQKTSPPPGWKGPGQDDASAKSKPLAGPPSGQ